MTKIGLEEITSSILTEVSSNVENKYLTLEEITTFICEVQRTYESSNGALEIDLDNEEIEITPGGYIFKHLRAFIGNLEDFKRANHGTPKTRLTESGNKELKAKLANFSAINPKFDEVKKIVSKLVIDKTTTRR